MLRRRVIGLVPWVVLAAGLALRAADPPLLEETRLRLFDTLQRLHPRPYRPAPVRIVDLDEETLARFGQWPWPRTRVAQLVRRLDALGAGVIAFDIVFAEPDRTSPAAVASLWPQTPEMEPLRERLNTLPSHDQILAQAMAETRVVTGMTLIPQANGIQPALKAGFAHAGDDPRAWLPDFKGAVVNLAPLEAAASGSGCFTILADRDALIRGVPLLFRQGETLYPSLVAETLRVFQSASGFLVKSSGASGEKSFGERTGINHVKVGALTVPTDAQGRVWLYDTGFVPERFIPAWRVLEGDLPPGSLEGYLVFIGTTAAGLKDLRATPLNPVAAGVEVHAQLAEQILQQNFLVRPDWAGGAEWAYLLALGLLLTVLLPNIGPAWCALLAVGATGSAVAWTWIAFTRWQWLFDPLFPSAVVLGIYLVSSLARFLQSERERRWVRTAFSRYMSPELVRRLAEHPDQLTLGGESRNMTLLFADIRGFTTLSEQFDAQALTRFINRFLTPMTDLILKHRGTIDKYMGDCIMAFWNAPLDDADHARHACEAALAMRDYLVGWNRQLQEQAQAEGKSLPAIRLGIGINTGDCCVGNLGSEQRFDYSVLGDEVNLASRLEGQSKTYGVDILLGPATGQAVREFALLELDLIRVAGKCKAVRLFGLLGDRRLAATPEFQALRARHEAMLAAYRQQAWQKAGPLLQACLALDTPQLQLKTLYGLYRRRIEAYRAAPPGPDWDGVFTATSK